MIHHRVKDALPEPPQLGLRANWRQFTLLVLVNAFVGAMLGLERAVLPLLAQREFGIASVSAALGFIATFGLVKAATNLLAGRLNDRWGRKCVLVLGWLFGLPVPLLIIWAPSWSWIVLANVLLGVNQGLAWSTTVIMKIDMIGAARRGLAMGLNEFAGGLALDEIALPAFAYPATWGVAQLATGALSDRWSRRRLIVWGMLLQGAALLAIALTRGLALWLACAIALGLGLGTAMVYPSLLAVVGDVARPAWRGTAVGVYRLWRDLGYVVGALAAGALADRFGMPAAIGAIGALTLASGLAAAMRLPETRGPAKPRAIGDP